MLIKSCTTQAFQFQGAVKDTLILMFHIMQVPAYLNSREGGDNGDRTAIGTADVTERRTMATGKVKWFNNAKGYGFIRPDAGGEDLFVHYSYIQMDGYRSLKAGQPVEYELQEANKGYHAVNLKPAESTDQSTDAPPLAAAPVTER